MKFYDCPYCKKSTASFVIYCGLLFSKSYKKCRHCSNDINISLLGFFSFYLVAIAIVVFFLLILPPFLPEELKIISMGGIFILVGIQFFIPDIVNRIFGLHLFKRKDS
jgi:hypothetical protein